MLSQGLSMCGCAALRLRLDYLDEVEKLITGFQDLMNDTFR
jgi:hypothetical protein